MSDARVYQDYDCGAHKQPTNGTFDLPGITAGHPADIPLEAVEDSVGHVGRTP